MTRAETKQRRLATSAAAEAGNCNPGSPAPKGRRTAALAAKHARLEIAP